MKSFFKFLLVFFIWLVVLGLCLGVCILLEQELQLGVMIFLGILFTWYFIKFLIFIVKRINAKNRVEKLINHDKDSTGTKKISLLQFFIKRDIDKHISKVIKAINRIGSKSNSAPTKWVMHLKINNTDGQWLYSKSVNRPKVTEPVFNEHPFINWLVFNEFVLLDVDEYLLSENNGAAQLEWYQLLNGLAASDKVMPVDSIVFSVNVNTIETALEQQKLADQLRRHYEDIRTFCGVEVNINIVLIGMDKLNGIDTWLSNLDPILKQKAFGVINSGTSSAEQLVQQTFSELGAVFSQGSLSYLVKYGYEQTAAELPFKASEIEDALTKCLTRLFSNNSFQNAPNCSGLFLVMEQESNFCFVEGLLEQPSLSWPYAVKTNVVTLSYKEKRKRKLLYLAGCSSLFGMIYLIYGQSMASLDQLMDKYQSKEFNLNNQSGLLESISARHELINDLQTLNVAHWFAQGNDPLKLNVLRAKTIDKIQKNILNPLDEVFLSDINKFDEMSINRKVDYITVLSRRINLINSAINGTGINDLALMPQPYNASFIRTMPAQLIEKINTVYLQRIDLLQQSGREKLNTLLSKEKTQFQNSIISLLSSNNDNLEWLTNWVNQNQSIKDITLASYWQGTVLDADDIKVPRVYTVAGKAVIDSFFSDLRLALGEDNQFLAVYQPKFIEQYQINYLASWGAFLTSFNLGEKTLATRDQWLNVINNLTTGRNIYFKLLNELDFQLAPFKDSENVPQWLEFALYYQDMLALGEDKVNSNKKKNAVLTKLALKLIGSTGAVGKAIAGSAKSGLKTQKKLDKASGSGPGPTERELNLQQAATELDNYKSTLADLVFKVEQKSESYKNAVGYFSNPDNPAAAGTSLAAAQGSIQKLQGLVGKSGISTAPFWQIYTGPVSLLEQFMVKEAACKLDDFWQEKFLFELQGVPSAKFESFAYGEGGILWGFIDSYIQPFIYAKKAGIYTNKRVNELGLPFLPDYLSYLSTVKDFSKRQKFESFSLDITSKPTSLNNSALLYVSKTQLALQCASGEQKIENNNYITSQHFTWEQSCGPVSLSFQIGNKTIVKSYPGQDGLKHFLNDFKAGKKRFETEEFAEHFYVLDQFKIRYLDVTFEIEGGAKLLSALNQQPPSPPKNLAMCWSRYE